MRTHSRIPCVVLRRANWLSHCNDRAIKYKILIFFLMLASLSKKQKEITRVKRDNAEQTDNFNFAILIVKYCCEKLFERK